ncbi:Ppx/GppA phosphatase family protein [Neobacillus sp. LXY-1]|uniref:Ppx/GppA phosphatase family protein n=1 Tax=Neobacillus sp. LXY-1 TaxID=3379133 RepID=UPI003EE34AEE
MKERVAIIDIGSNTIRLVIYEKLINGRQLKEIENIKVSSRLRMYLDDKLFLKDEGISLLIETLQNFKMMLDLYGVSEIFCVATATVRQASNKKDIVQIIQERTGFTITVLTDYEEAYLGYLAVSNSINIHEAITIDMGGGSTELTYFRNKKLVHYVSLPFGALSLKLQFVKDDIPTIEELQKIRNYVLAQIEKLTWVFNKHVPIIAMGGSARNVAKLHQGIIQYPLADIHHYEMKLSDIHDVRELLTPLSLLGIQDVEGISKDRADIILPAIEFFEVLCHVSKATQFIVSNKGLREGVLYQRLNRNQQEITGLIDSEIHELMHDYYVDPIKSKQFIHLATMFFEQVKGINGIGIVFSDHDRDLLKQGASIFHLGKYLYEESGPYVFHLIANRPIVGLSHRERIKLALVASFKSRGAFRQHIEPFKDWYTKEERKKICLLGAILKVSRSLNSTGRNIVRDIKITSQGNSWVMDIQTQNNYAPEKYQLEKQKKHIEKLLKITLIPHFQMIES